MPLAVVCGLPCSGKTRFSHALAQYLRENTDRKVVVVSEQSVHAKRSSYANSVSERETRSLLKAAVERALNKSDFVICDSLNSVKGFRYELYCRARTTGTPHCVIFCNTEVSKCREWNAAREGDDGYDSSLFDDLASRMEYPDSSRRWDKPYFEVETPSLENCPFEAISQVLLLGKSAKSSMATVPQRMETAKFLYDIDRVTMDIVQSIISSQSNGNLDLISVPFTCNKINLRRPSSAPALHRLRREFIKFLKTSPKSATSNEVAADLFVVFINERL